MDILQAIILGLTQGLTEWLPISSSGHLVLLKHLFGIQQPVIYDIILHLASLIVVLAVFYKDILRIIKERDYDYVLKLVLASVPIAIVGLLFNQQIKAAFNSIKLVALFFLITTAFLYATKYAKKKVKLNLMNSFMMGVAQSLAILPGVSRSGATISTGLIQGVDRKQAATFSFLLFIPAILGATVLEIKNISQITDILPLSIAFVVTVITGYLSLKLLLKIINKGKFHHFAWYTLAIALFILFFL